MRQTLSRRHSGCAAVLCAAWACAALPAAAARAPRIEVQLGDNASFYSGYHDDLSRAAVAAAQGWTQHLAGDFSGLDLTLRINFVSLPTATGRWHLSHADALADCALGGWSDCGLLT